MEENEEPPISSPPSSPPTPPSPLPISIGPGNQKYAFSLSPSSSPPFSPPTSAESLPLLPQQEQTQKQQPSPFSVDRKQPENPEDCENDNTCYLKEMFAWFMEKCCSCSS